MAAQPETQVIQQVKKGQQVQVQQVGEEYEGVTLSEFKTNTRPIFVEWFGKRVRVEYMPGNMDDQHYLKQSALEGLGDEQHHKWLVAYFLNVVHSIPSIRMEDGEPFMPTEENIPRLPVILKNRIVNAISEDLFPKEGSANGSNGSSSPAVAAG